MTDRDLAHRAVRGSEVAAWVRRFRDTYPRTSNEWDALDALLDDYRLHADTGTALTQRVPAR